MNEFMFVKKKFTFGIHFIFNHNTKPTFDHINFTNISFFFLSLNLTWNKVSHIMVSGGHHLCTIGIPMLYNTAMKVCHVERYKEEREKMCM